MGDSFAQHRHNAFPPTMGVEIKTILVFKKITAFCMRPFKEQLENW